MGYITDETGFMLFGKTPEGKCEMCCVKHEEGQPHDRQSLTYQYKFYDLNGRWPTWADAMAHCNEETKIIWTNALEKRGIEVGGEKNG